MMVRAVKRTLINLLFLAAFAGFGYYIYQQNIERYTISYVPVGVVDSLTGVNDSLKERISFIESKYHAVLHERAELYFKIDSMNAVLKEFEHKVDSLTGARYYVSDFWYDVFGIRVKVFSKIKPDSVSVNVFQRKRILVDINILKRNKWEYAVYFNTNSKLVHIDSAKIYIKRKIRKRANPFHGVWAQAGIGYGLMFGAGYKNWGLSLINTIDNKKYYFITYRKEF